MEHKEHQAVHENLLLIFTRNPELGKVKTRLAKTVGAQTALSIYTFLLYKTKEIATKVASDKAVYYSVRIRKMIFGMQLFFKNTNKLVQI